MMTVSSLKLHVILLCRILISIERLLLWTSFMLFSIMYTRYTNSLRTATKSFHTYNYDAMVFSINSINNSFILIDSTLLFFLANAEIAILANQTFLSITFCSRKMKSQEYVYLTINHISYQLFFNNE